MSISKSKVLSYIQDSYSEIHKLKKVKEDCEDFLLWRYKTDNVVKQIFGEQSSEFKSIHMSLFPQYAGITPRGIRTDYHENYLKRLDTLYAKLKSLEDTIELSYDDVTEKNEAVYALNHILHYFQMKNH